MAGLSIWHLIREVPAHAAGSITTIHGLAMRRVRWQKMRNAFFSATVVVAAAVVCACLFRGHFRVRQACPPSLFAVETLVLIIILHEHKEWTRNGGGMEEEPRCKRGACLLGK